MDGDGVTAYAFSGSASNVVIKHLVIRAYAPTAGDQGMINATGSLGWVVDSNEIANSTQQGVRIGKAGHLGWNYIHHNRVVGASLFQGDRTVIEGNHFAFNPPGSVTESGATARASQMKIFRSVGVVVRNNVIEDGTRKGIWFDTDNYLAVIENNTIRRQAQACIWYEAGYDATITGNTIAGCGNGSTSSWPSDAGIQVTNSYPITITNNTVSGANNGIVGMAVGGSSNPDYTTGNRGPKALGIHASGNTVTQPQGWAAGVRTTGTGADSAFTWSGHSTWTANRYNTTGNVSAAWTWLNAGKTQAQWQGLGFDTP
jgi:nitrous oxidase accessory protein NosD